MLPCKILDNVFHFVMPSVLRKAGVHRNAMIFSGGVKLLADDIDIIGLTKRNFTAAFCVLERESAVIRLMVKEDKIANK